MKKSTALLLGILAVAAIAKGQSNYRVAGIIRDAQSKLVPGATITLLKAIDTSVVKFTASNGDGQFELDKLDGGSFLLKISSVGYLPYTSRVFQLGEKQPLIRFDSLSLSPQAGSLEGVTVISRKPLVEQKIDRTIVNVDAAVTNVGATALEVLEKSPGVQVDRDGNVSLKGKQGVLILIDGKQSYLAGSDLAALLASMSASQLDQIEIMTNPPAKYDASGNSGVINIKTKKNNQRGFNGSLNLSYSQGVYAKTSNSLNLNYRNPKFNVFLNYTLNQNNNFTDLHIQRKYYGPDGITPTAYFDQPTFIKFHIGNNTLKLGMDYYLSKKTTIGFTASGFLSPRNFDGYSIGYIQDENQVTDSIARTDNHNHDRWTNGTVNLNLKHQIDSSKELTADIDFIQYKSNNQQLFNNASFYPDKTVISDGQLKGELPSNIRIFSAKADYSQTLRKGTKLEAGWKSSLVKTDNAANYFIGQAGNLQPDYERTNRFLYEENINALYVNMNKQVNKWSFQAGLRFENTNYDGHQLGNIQKPDSAFTRHYNSLFPTAFVSYVLDSNNTVTVNFGRRIDRPAYQSLNPFYFFINKYTYSVGNPFLDPQYTNNIELSHIYKGKYTTTASYSHTSGYTTQIFRTEGETTILTQDNLGTRQNFGVSETMNLSFSKWWTATLSANVNYQIVDGVTSTSEKIHTEGWNGQLNMNNQFRFKKGWSAELSGFYNSKEVEGQFSIQPFGQVSIGGGKQIMKSKGTIKLSLRDIFYTQVIHGQILYGNVEEHFIQSRDSRLINVSFVYRFGKNFKESGRKKNGGAGEEQSRVGVSS